MIKLYRTMRPLTKFVTILMSLAVVVSIAYVAIVYYSDTAWMALGKYEDKFYRTTVIEMNEDEFILEIQNSDSQIHVPMTGDAEWDGQDVTVTRRYVPVEVGEMIVWGVRYRTDGTIMYTETLLRKETSSNAEES